MQFWIFGRILLYIFYCSLLGSITIEVNLSLLFTLNREISIKNCTKTPLPQIHPFSLYDWEWLTENTNFSYVISYFTANECSVWKTSVMSKEAVTKSLRQKPKTRATIILILILIPIVSISSSRPCRIFKAICKFGYRTSSECLSHLTKNWVSLFFAFWKPG